MQFKIFSSPAEMMDEIRKRNTEKRNCARIVAGFCWLWSDPIPAEAALTMSESVISRCRGRKKTRFGNAQDNSGNEQVGTVYQPTNHQKFPKPS